MKLTLGETVPTAESEPQMRAIGGYAPVLVANHEDEDPLSRAQVLASIRAAKRLHLPTGEVLRAVRRQIDQD